ncbi:ABC transporter ATP-binding protein [candidate division KSB1 bacterium]|nr:ABC transporter ATP-binding protein [bacterium]RKY79817.1 MAG: ABC transporter ATP-binding protein [candidate division KSB1 bacterium]
MQIYLRILKYVKPYWGLLLGSLVCILFFTFFSSATLVSVIPFLRTIFNTETTTLSHEISPPASDSDQRAQIPLSLSKKKQKIEAKLNRFLIGGDRRQGLARICVLILIIIFFKNLFDYLQAYLMAHVEQGVIKDLRNDLYQRIIYMPLSFFSSSKTGMLISRITNDVTLVNGGISAGFVTLIKNPLLVLVYVGLAFYLSWQLTLTALIVLPFSLVVISHIGLRLRRASTESQEEMAEVTSVLQETISGARAVKAFGMEGFEIRKFKHRTHNFFRSLLKITRTSRLASPITEFLGAIVGVAILWFGGQKVLAGNMLPPEHFIAFLLVIFSLMQPVKELGSVNNRIQAAIAAGKRIFEVLDMEPEIVSSPGAIKLQEFRHQIEFVNVGFSYENKKTVLEGINLEVQKGEVLAIVGPSGVGKSTLVDLLPRFYDPTEGAILLDGYDLRQLELRSLRQLMGIVTQETILFNDTVRNNIAYGLQEIPLEKVMMAAQAANAHEFIMELPDGYETFVGERGVKLSGGQRQRLAIARALLKNPPILILDEATSALDTESEVLVQEAIERLMSNRTVFVIAHRLSTIQNADKIIVLEEGRIVQQGQHEELVQQPGPYRRLYKLQFHLQKVEGSADVG